MKKFLYIALVCGVLSGAGVFFNIPQYPNVFLPIAIAGLGIVSTLLTFMDKTIGVGLKLGGIFINVMPLLGGLMTYSQQG